MDNLMDKRFYKVISLFIKAILLIASFYYISQKLTTPEALASYRQIEFSSQTIYYLSYTCLLMFFNWGLEAVKWQLLIAPYEEISWLQSMRSIFAGVTIGIFTPNRVGEFTGRIFFLKKADRLIASLKSITGSFFQLSITMMAGFLGLWLYIREGYHLRVPIFSVVEQERKAILLLTLCSAGILALIMVMLSFFAKLKYQMKEVFNVKKTDLLTVLLLSIARYIVFTLQYYLLLVALGVEIGLVDAFTLISLIFFITAVIPSFALTEIVVRSAVAVYIFNVLDSPQPALIASASLLLWIINLAIPALIGSTCMAKLQFFRSH
jgi:uncharacterized membrane protein YbhN (UPF0104 family)